MSGYEKTVAMVREIDERMARVRRIQLDLEVERARFGVKPGESLWQAWFGVPFPLDDQDGAEVPSRQKEGPVTSREC